MSPDTSSISFPNRLWLRQATQADAEAIFTIFSDPEVTQFHDLDTFTRLDEPLRSLNGESRDSTVDAEFVGGLLKKQTIL